jgi:DNA repair exonuclease SbcCD ATPase subunit
MKKTIFISTLSSLVVVTCVCASTANAQTPSPAERREERKTELKETMTSAAKTRADQEIDRRITAMKALIERINKVKRITEEQKTVLTAQLQTNIDNLTTLKAKIDADTDAATLKTDKQSIVDSYRIFAVVMPQVEVIAHADNILQMVESMNANTITLRAKAEEKGKDLTTVQALIDDRQAKLDDATAQATKAISTVLPLTPGSYPGSKDTFMSARDMLKTARTDLQAAHTDMVKIGQTLKLTSTEGTKK